MFLERTTSVTRVAILESLSPSAGLSINVVITVNIVSIRQMSLRPLACHPVVQLPLLSF